MNVYYKTFVIKKYGSSRDTEIHIHKKICARM